MMMETAFTMKIGLEASIKIEIMVINGTHLLRAEARILKMRIIAALHHFLNLKPGRFETL